MNWSDIGWSLWSSAFKVVPRTLIDCNENGVADACDIAVGTSRDGDGDGVPDECQCPADCDRSGSLDIFDFLCFQNHFAVADPRADCDASGVLDFFDFLCFQDAFGAGCP